MRKSTGIAMAIILMGLVGMMFAANMALKPFQRYAKIGAELTEIMHMRAQIREGTKVHTLARKADERRLAREGFGMVIELSPSADVMRRKGALAKLAFRVAREAGSLYDRGKGTRLEWFEVKLDLAPDVMARTLIAVGPEGRLGPPVPDLPATHP